jgi:hypothetical protein
MRSLTALIVRGDWCRLLQKYSADFRNLSAQ